MIQTLFVYLFISLIFLLLSFWAKKKRSFNVVIIAILIYSFFMGVRYGVGKDFFSYKEIYNYYQETHTFFYKRLEVGFKYIVVFFNSINLPYGGFLGFIAFFQLYLIYRSVKEKYFIYPFLAFTFCFGCFWLDFSNLLRQVLAFSIFTYSIKYICNRKIIKYFFYVLLATLIHKSAFLLFLMYFLFFHKVDWFRSRRLQFTLLFLSLAFMKLNLVVSLSQYLEPFIALLDYEFYLDASSRLLIADVNIGFGFFFLLFINIIIIYYSNEIRKTKWLNIVYTLYFVGVLWNYVFIDSLIFKRISTYLYNFQFIIGAFTLYYLFRANKVVFMVLILLYILIFISTIYRMDINTARYIFNWQKELFYLKNEFM